MTAAPSIKEALERLLFTAKILQQNSVGCATNHYGHDCELNGLPGWLTDTQKDIDAATTALATLSPPAGERREAIARILEPQAWAALGIGDTLAYKNRRTSSLRKADRILASGLVQDEAGWRDISTAPKDMTEIIVLCGPKDVRLGWYFAPSSTTFGWFDQHQKPIKPTHWMPFPPIRSARDGGTET